jgi:hypothetical protein
MCHPALIATAVLLTGSALAAAQATGDRVKVNGMQMYYEVSGTGDPLIVLHGAYMNIPSMGAIIPKLAQTHELFVWCRHGTRARAAADGGTAPTLVTSS